MTSSRRRRLWLPRLAIGFNGAAAFGCALLVALAPSRAGALLGAGGFVFFGLAAVGFALMLRLRLRGAVTGGR